MAYLPPIIVAPGSGRGHGGGMRHKFLGTGEPGYHPLRKLRTVFSGLRYAVIYDFSVAYKLLLSTVVLAAAFLMRA
jgi:diacylglycerol kinase (ATP)